MTRKNTAVFIFFFYLLCYIMLLGARDLAIPDETRYGEIPREMLRGGDWISPRLNGARYFEKPILGYWLHAVSIGVLGENNFAVRFPSALAAGLTALTLYLFMRRTGTRPNDGAMAALIYLSSFGVFIIGHIAVLDSAFSFFTTLSCVFFFLGTEVEAENRPIGQKTLLWGAAGFFCACAFLTKGFLAAAIPAAAFVPYFLWTRQGRRLPRACLLPLFVAVLVVFPWGLSIHMKEPDFWRFFFWNEHVKRFFAENAQHARSFWFFFVIGPLMALPWSFLAPSAFMGILSSHGGGRRERTIKFCVCWLVFPFLLFSASHGKLPTYILPCLPPFAVLMALGLMEPSASSLRGKVFQWGLYLNIALFSVVALALFYLQFFGKNRTLLYFHAYQLIMLLNCIVFFVLVSMNAGRLHDPETRIWRVALAPLLLFVTVHFLVPDLTVEITMPGKFIKRHAAEITERTVIVADEDMAGAVCWYLKRNDVYVVGGAGELTYGLSCEGVKRHIGPEDAARLIRSNPGNVVLIARAKLVEQLEEWLPLGFAEHRSNPSGNLVLRKY